MQTRSFLAENINRAIALTNSGLEGPCLDWGVHDLQTPQNLYTTTINLVNLAVGLNQEGPPAKPTDREYADVFACSYEEYLAMCRRLFNDCDHNQQAGIGVLVREIIKQSEKMKAEFAQRSKEGKKVVSHWLRPLDKSNAWGRCVLALAEAFDVKLEGI